MNLNNSNLNYPFIVTANGISYSSLQQIGEVLPSRTFGAAKVQPYIDIATGSLMLRTPVVSLVERNFPVALSYIFDSSTRAWHFMHKRFKKLPPKPEHYPFDTAPAILIEEDGRETTYTYDSNSNFWWPPNLGENTPSLGYDFEQNLWVLFDSETQIKEHYNQAGNLLGREDAAGRVTKYEYTDPSDASRLTAIIGPSGTRYEIYKEDVPGGGYVIAFRVKSKDNNVKDLQVQHFDGSNRLIKTVISLADNNQNYEINYRYYGDGNLIGFSQSNGTELGFTYDNSNLLKSIYSDETRVQLSYSQNDKTKLPLVILENTHGTQNKFHLDEQKRICKAEYPKGFPLNDEIPEWNEKLYTYDNGRLKSIQHPGGGYEEFAYSDRKEGLLTYHLNPNGQKTEYYYDLSHGRHLCVCTVNYLNDQPVVARKVYDYNYTNSRKAFLRFEISPEGRVTEYRPDPWGNVGSKRVYIHDYYDLTRFQPDKAPILEYMLEWIEGKEAQVSLIDYIYDPERRAEVLITEAYGHVDANGNGIDDALKSKDITNYNIFGNLLGLVHTQSAGYDPAYTEQEYDGLQRVTTKTNPLEETIQYKYLDAERKVIVTQPNGRIEEISYNKRGFVEQSKQIATVDNQIQIRETKYSRDAMGRLVVTELPDQRSAYTFYDCQFRLGYQVIPIGSVTEHRYNLEKRFNTFIEYNNPIDVSELAGPYPDVPPQVWQLIELIQADAQHDRCSYEFFDKAGNLRYTVDADNYIIEIQYDTLNRPVAKIAYHQPLADSDLEILKDGGSIELEFNPIKDRCTGTFYDNDGLVIGKQDPAGYVTEYKRNAAGWIAEKINYYLPKIPNLSVQSFNDILLSLSDDPLNQDAHTYYFYNHRGLCEIEVDAEGYVTEKSYFAGGLLDKTKHYLNKVDESWLKNPIARPSLPKSTSEDKTIIHEYDLLDRPLKQKNNLGEQADIVNQIIANAYDVMGHTILNHIQDAQHTSFTEINGDTLHGLEQQCDAWEQVTNEANAYITLELAKIDANPNLNPEQKQAAKDAIWHKYSTRHFYDGNGLLLKTLMNIATETQFNNQQANDAITVYYYDDERRPIAIINPTGAITEKTYNNFGEAIAVRNYINRIPADKFSTLTGGYLSAHAEVRQLLDGLQNDIDPITKLKLNKRGLTEEITDPEDYKTTKQYNAFRQCIVENLPVTAKEPSLTVTHDYETRGLEIRTSKRAGDLATCVTRRFNNPYGKETEYVDENEGVYKTSYDALGLIKQTINPKNIKTREYTHDAFGRVDTETNSLNQITQHTYNQAKRTHTITTLATDVTVTTQANIFSETIKVTDGLNQSESFQHTPDGQVATYTDALQNKTEDKYNLQGWHAAHIDADQVDTSFTQNAAGELIEQVEDTQGLKLKTSYERDGLGRATSITDPRQIKTEQEFDRRGKIIKTKKQLSDRILTTEIAYNGQGNKILQQRGDESKPKQSLHTMQRDDLNRAIGSTVDPNGLNIQTQQHLDAAGHVIASIDPNSNIIRSFYNELGQKRFTVTPIGQNKAALKEWQFDSENRVRYERVYVKGIDPSTLTDKTPIKTIEDQAKNSVDNFDTLTWYFFDADNKERFVVKILAAKTTQQIILKGIVTEKCYDKAKREIQVYQYENTIDATYIADLTTEQLAQLMATKVEPAGDRITYKILDANNQERFVIDPKGAITEQRFDKNRQVITKVCYANMLSAAEATQVAQLSENAVLDWLIQHSKVEPNNDRATYFIFDRLKSPEFTLDAAGGVVRFKHDADKNLTEECHFKTPLNPISVSYEALVIQVRQNYSGTPDFNTDRVTRHEYDDNNQLIKTIDAKGNIDIFERDALGNIRKHTDRSNNIWQYAFDNAERVIDEISPATDITIIEKDAAGKLVPKQLIAQTVVKHNDYDKASNKTAIIEAANLSQDQQRKINFDFTANNQLQVAEIKDVPVAVRSEVASSFINRPEEQQDIKVTVVYNNKQLKVAEQNEIKQWEFTVYDSLDKPLYKINMEAGVVKVERNAFDEVIREIRFANRLEIDLAHYTTNGIPQVVVESYLTPNVKEDRITEYLRDKQGNVELIKQGPVFSYLPDNPPVYGFVKTETKKAYNAFKECIYFAQLINPTQNSKTWTEEYTWVNRLGEKLATCNPNKYVKRYSVNTFGEIEKTIEWANKLSIDIHLQTTLAQIDAAYQPSAEDRTLLFEYDGLGQKVKATIVNVVTQVLKFKEENGKQTSYLEDLPAQDLSISYQYNPIQLHTATTHEDGNTQYIYYDGRGFKIAETGIPFDNNGQTAQLIPLTYYHLNPHGQTTVVTRFKTGTAKSNGSNLPIPLVLDPENDQTELKLFDRRGLTAIKQDAMGYQKSYVYTPTRRVAREYWNLTNWLQDNQDKMKFITVTHLDEKRFEYDNLDQPLALKIYRDNSLVEQTWTAFNTFGNAISEGSQQDPATHELFRKFDLLGNIWCTNAAQGASTITIRDLAARETLQLQSPTQALSKIDYEKIPELLTLDIEEIERTETAHDLLGNTLKKSSPAAYSDDPNQPENIPLNMLVSHPQEQMTTISWTVPQEKNVEAEFWLYPKDNTSAKQSLKIEVVNGRCRVDVSNFITDTYNYHINYFFVDPIKNQNDKLMYTTKGILQFDTGNSENSKTLVTVVENLSNLRLTGNTTGITAVKLYQDDQEIADLNVPADKIIKLESYRSGIYTIKPIINGQIGAESFPFTILNQHAPKDTDTPFAREIPCAVALKTLNQNENAYGQLTWQVPEQFRFQPVKLTCHYTATDDINKTETFTVWPNQLLFPHRDKNDNYLLQNLQFSAQIKTVNTISLALQINTNNPSIENEEWVTLYTSMLPLPDPILLQAKLANMEHKRIRLTAELLRETYKAVEDDVIDTNNFPSTLTLYVTPITELMEDSIITYRDTSLDLQADNKQIACTSITRKGFFIDVSGFQPGSYPFQINDKKGIFTVTQGEILFTSQPGAATQKIIQQPTRQFEYDAWSNQTIEIDSLSHVTNYKYNYLNQLLTKIQPEVDVVDFTGGSNYEFKPARPVTRYGYNLRGFNVGVLDANQHTEGFILDNVGHTIVTILAEGTRSNTVQYDALSRVTQHADARNNISLNHFDRNNNLLSTRSPLGKVNTYGYSELNSRNLEINPAQETRHYNFDAQGDLSERYEPLGQCTTMQYQRRQLIQTNNPDGSVLTWKRDYFGLVHEHKDLSGAVIYSEYHYTQQLKQQYSQGGYRGHYYKLTKQTRQEWLVSYHQPGLPKYYPVTVDYYIRSFLPVPSQRVIYKYALGRVIEIHDIAGDKLTSYEYDTEGRLKAAQINNLNGSILYRKVETQVDALSREVYTHDGESTFITAYDLVNNRRFVKAQVASELGNILKTTESWWDYDAADFCTIDNGVLTDGKVKITNGQGIAYGYQNGLRQTETKIVGANSITATQTFDADGFLVRSDITTGEYSTREYHLSGWQKRFTDVVQLDGPFVHLDHQIQCNSNSWVLQDIQSKDNKSQIVTYYDNHTAVGNPLRQITNYNDEQNTSDYLTNSYIGDDTWRLYQVSGQRHNKHGWSNASVVSVYCGPNSEQNAIIGQQENDTERQNVFFDATSDGLILSRLELKGHMKNDEKIPYEVVKTRYFYSVNGAMLGSSSQKLDNYTFNREIHLDTDLIKHGSVAKGMYELCPYNPRSAYSVNNVRHQVQQHKNFYRDHVPIYNAHQSTGLISNSVRSYGSLQINNFLRPSTFADPLLGGRDEVLTKAGRWIGSKDIFGHEAIRFKGPMSTTAYGAENAVALSATSTIAQYGDTYESIAKRMKGDPNLADLIAQANGGLALQPGRPIFIPQMILAQNKAGYARAYTEFMAIIMGSLTPHLNTRKPKQHHSFWEAVVAIIVVAVATIITGGAGLNLGAMMVGQLGFATGSLGAAVVTGAVGALTDAALQGLAIGLGLQSSFSWEQVLEVGFMVGVDAGFGEGAAKGIGGATAKKALSQQVAERIMMAGKVAVSMQLVEMAAGYRKQFDMASVGAAIFGAGLDIQLTSHDLSDSYGLISLTSRSVLDAGLHGRTPNLEGLAAQFLGQGMVVGGLKAIDALQNTSHPYSQSQQAAQGDAKHPVLSNHNNRGVEERSNHLPSSSVSKHYRSRTYADMRAEQALREELKITIDPNQPIDFEDYSHSQSVNNLNRVSGSRAGFWNSSANKIRELNQIINNTSGGKSLQNFVGKAFEYSAQELKDLESWASSTADYMGYQAKIAYPNLKTNIGLAYNQGVKTFEHYAELSMRYGNLEGLKSMSQQVENYFINLDREYLKSYGVKTLRYAGRGFDVYEWAVATQKVNVAWQHDGLGEAIWVGTKEYGGLVASGVGGTLAAIGTVAVLPEELVGLTIWGAVTSIGARTFGGALSEGTWKTVMEGYHSFKNDEPKYLDSKKLNM